MMKVNFILVVALWILCFASVSVLAYEEDQEPEEATTEIIEIDEGIYQVMENDELSTEYGNVDESAVDESSSGSDNGENNNTGSEYEYSEQEGNTSSDAGTTEEVEQTDTGSQNEQLISIDQKMDTLHEDMIKIMISMWVLCGLYLGTKLIRGLFG